MCIGGFIYSHSNTLDTKRQVLQKTNFLTTTPHVYVSLYDELQITLNPDFVIQPYQDSSGFIFVATSTTDLLTIKKVVGEEDIEEASPEVVIDVMYKIAEKEPVSYVGTQKIVWSNLTRSQIGANFVLSRDGIRTTKEYGREIKERVRSYMLYNNKAVYIITFQNYYPNISKTAYWDKIVSTVIFK